MEKVNANVRYPYTPKNHDELELKVGDQIEVIGFEEEGWYRGRLRGKTGVFPSNFVEVIDGGSSQNINLSVSPLNTQVPQNQASSKLNLFVNRLAKPTLSSNNSIGNSGNINNLSNNNHLEGLMDNAQQQDVSTTDDPSSSERKPKPIRGVGYGDIFSGAKLKLTPVDQSTHSPMDRLSSSLTGQLQKPIPKKPPPPAPTDKNPSSSDQAPPPPPKPITSQFDSLSHSNRLQGNTVREQVRVIFPYQATHEDELTINEGDIIDVISKKIEDQGWWKGELRGKVGVFPDNFVELIKHPSQQPNPDIDIYKPHHSFLKSATQPAMSYINSSIGSNSSDQEKSRAFMKGFSKELENNLEKSSNTPASFLSLKRNKHPSLPVKPKNDDPAAFNDNASSDSRNDLCLTNGSKSTPTNNVNTNPNGLFETSTVRLNHITANRAKGPARRPPSNIISKRSLSETTEIVKKEQNGSSSNSSSIVASLPTAPLQDTTLPVTKTPLDEELAPVTNKSNISLESVINEHIAASTPRAFQRSNPSSAEKNSTDSSPQWMVQLKKAQAEKKRETSASNPKLNEPVAQETVPGQPVVEKSRQEVPKVVETAKAPRVVGTTVANQVVETTKPLQVVNIDPEIISELNEVKRFQSEEFVELKEELRKLKGQVSQLVHLKGDVEEMKRYMKDLVGILADERKKMAAMQVELKSNMK